jgi:hypothetical protein
MFFPFSAWLFPLFRRRGLVHIGAAHQGQRGSASIAEKSATLAARNTQQCLPEGYGAFPGKMIFLIRI